MASLYFIAYQYLAVNRRQRTISMTKRKLCSELTIPKPHYWIVSKHESRYSNGECKNCGLIMENYFDNRPDLRRKTLKGQKIFPISVNGRNSY